MAKKVTQVRLSPKDLLNRLDIIQPDRNTQLSEQLKVLPLETQLLALADISIERETKELREILSRLGKLSNKQA